MIKNIYKKIKFLEKLVHNNHLDTLKGLNHLDRCKNSLRTSEGMTLDLLAKIGTLAPLF